MVTSVVPGAVRTIDSVLAQARRGVPRVQPAQLRALLDAGALVVDIRPERPRVAEGHLPGAVVIDRLVLEWRLDPTSGATMPDGPGYDDVIVVVCNEGYASSLAARDLRVLGFRRATDLVGGFRGYARGGSPVAVGPTRVID